MATLLIDFDDALVKNHSIPSNKIELERAFFQIARVDSTDLHSGSGRGSIIMRYFGPLSFRMPQQDKLLLIEGVDQTPKKPKGVAGKLRKKIAELRKAHRALVKKLKTGKLVSKGRSKKPVVFKGKKKQTDRGKPGNRGRRES